MVCQIKPHMEKKRILGLTGVLLCVLICLLPAPGALRLAAESVGSTGDVAMKILGITALSLCWWAGGTAPNWLVAIVMLLLWVVLGQVPFTTAFSAFGSTSVWLIVGSFCLAASISKTGLFRRISWYLIRLFSPSFGGQVLALLLCGTICGPLVPSSTAKAVLGASIAKNIADSLEYEPDSPGRCGLFVASFIGFSGVSAAFMSGSIHTYMVYGLLPQGSITWGSWLLYALPWLAVVLPGSFLLLRRAFSPGSSRLLTREYVDQECAALGAMQKKERISAVLLAGAAVLWILEAPLHIPASVTALGAACLCFATGILDSRELSTAVPWDLVVFNGCVLNLSAIFSQTGLDLWLQELIAPLFTGLNSPILTVPMIVLATILLHWILASQSATLIVLMTILPPIAAQSGIHPFVVGFAILSVLQCWFFPYQNATFASALSGMQGTLQHGRTVRGSFIFAAISLAGCLASIPFWRIFSLL